MGASPWTCFRTVTLPLAAPGLIASAIFVFLESLDEFTGTYFVGVPDVTTLPLLMFNASMGGNYQIASITALLLLIPSIAFMLVVERFLKADVLADGGALTPKLSELCCSTAGSARYPGSVRRYRRRPETGGPVVPNRS